MFKHKALKVMADDATLPASRTELFKTILKDDFYLLAELSVFCFLFSLPLALGFVAEIVLLGGMGMADASKVFSLCFYAGLVEIPLFGIRYVGRYAAFGQIIEGMHVIDAIVASLDSDDFLEGYYGATLGFLKQSSYLKITSAKVID